MRTFLRLLGALAALLLVVVLGGLALLAAKKPRLRPPSTETVEATPARLARGRYLVEHVVDCFGCHSGRDVTKYGLPLIPGTEGRGGFVFDEKLGIPGAVCAQNITSDRETGIGSWTDGEVLRAMREGIDRKGNALFPQMPYRHFRAMSDEDARSVVAFLRTLPPVRNVIPPRRLNFPVNFFVKWAPAPLEGPVASPDPAKDHLGYGKYLVTLGSCGECHTQHDDKGQLVAGKEFQGGWQMLGPWGRVVTANITPNPRVYMGQATKEQFVGRFKAFESIATIDTAPLATKGRNTVMPWLFFCGMTAEDLGAIYDYLKTLPPGGDAVTTFPDNPEAPTPPGGAVVPEKPAA